MAGSEERESMKKTFCNYIFTFMSKKNSNKWHLLVVMSANSNYELGRGDKVGGWKPKPIPSLEDVCVIQIASGGYHSLALTGNVIT